jgi:hypothetical protein
MIGRGGDSKGGKEMSRLQRHVFAATAVLLVLSARPLRAEMLGPGTYHGYAAIDRWGQNVFHTGPYHLFLNEEAAAELKPYRGQRLTLKVTGLWQPMNPGAGLIAEVGSVAVDDSPEVTLTVRPEGRKAVQGHGFAFLLRVENQSPDPVTLHPGILGACLVSHDGYPGKDIGYRAAHERAYWYHSTRLVNTLVLQGDLASRTEGQVSCRQIVLATTAEELCRRGESIAPTDPERGLGGPVTVAPGGSFEKRVVLGEELLPGQYQLFAFLVTNNFGYRARAMSDRVDFDVVPGNWPKDGQEFAFADGSIQVRLAPAVAPLRIDRPLELEMQVVNRTSVDLTIRDPGYREPSWHDRGRYSITVLDDGGLLASEPGARCVRYERPVIHALLSGGTYRDRLTLERGFHPNAPGKHLVHCHRTLEVGRPDEVSGGWARHFLDVDVTAVVYFLPAER